MQKQANIYTNKIKKIYFLKNEIKKILLKNIIQDNYILNIYKAFALKNQDSIKKKHSKKYFLNSFRVWKKSPKI